MNSKKQNGISCALAFLSLIVLSSCDNFEKIFYDSISQAQINVINNGFDTFDLSTITDFEWDSVILIGGNESVPIFKELIEEVLNRGDSKPVYKTTDLPTFRDRFYFLTPDKKLIEKEIDHKWGFQIYYCDKHISKETDWWWGYDFWLSKQEANFLVFSKEVTSTITYESSRNDTVVTWIRVWFEANCIEQ